MSIELPQLADTRSTQRLLNMLDKLEQHLANVEAVGGTTQGSDVAGVVDGEIVRLRKQNKTLQTRQKVALEHLDDLMARMAETMPTIVDGAASAQMENAA